MINPDPAPAEAVTAPAVTDLSIELWPIERPVPYDRNPRRNDHAVDAVAASIAAFGFRVPIVVDEQGVVLAGHTRLAAAIKADH